MFQKNSPENQVSFLNRQFLWWFNPIFKIGHQKALEVQDLYNIDEQMTAHYLHKKWEAAWTPVIQEYHKERQNMVSSQISIITDENEEAKIVLKKEDSVPLLNTRKKSNINRYGATKNFESRILNI